MTKYAEGDSWYHQDANFVLDMAIRMLGHQSREITSQSGIILLAGSDYPPNSVVAFLDDAVVEEPYKSTTSTDHWTTLYTNPVDTLNGQQSVFLPIGSDPVLLRVDPTDPGSIGGKTFGPGDDGRAKRGLIGLRQVSAITDSKAYFVKDHRGPTFAATLSVDGGDGGTDTTEPSFTYTATSVFDGQILGTGLVPESRQAGLILRAADYGFLEFENSSGTGIYKIVIHNEYYDHTPCPTV